MDIVNKNIDSFEQNNFITPLENITGVTFIGFDNSYNTPSHPVFNITDTTVSKVTSSLVKYCESCELDSGGLQAFFIHPQSTIESDTFENSDISIIFKIENWWASCIPNDVDNTSHYIEEREHEMKNNIQNKFPVTVKRDTHKDCLIQGGSNFEEDYGQYQFIGVC